MPEASWLTENSTDSGVIAAYYDAWAADYDSTLEAWNYKSPAVAAELMGRYVAQDGRILDAGCGTGLTGLALKRAGFGRVTGIDISADSLRRAAATGAYERVLQVNMQARPFPVEAASFDGLECVGVLTYLPETAETFREFCRLVRPGGHIIFTQRDDLYAERDYAGVARALIEKGMWREVHVSEPMLYLPQNADFGEKILVIYGVYAVG